MTGKTNIAWGFRKSFPKEMRFADEGFGQVWEGAFEWNDSQKGELQMYRAQSWRRLVHSMNWKNACLAGAEWSTGRPTGDHSCEPYRSAGGH